MYIQTVIILIQILTIGQASKNIKINHKKIFQLYLLILIYMLLMILRNIKK